MNFNWPLWLINRSINGNKILFNEENGDVKLKCGNEVFFGHKIILSISGTLKEFLERSNTEVEIDIISPERLEKVLLFLYHGQFPEKNLIQFLKDGFLMKIPDLLKKCSKLLEENLDIENALLVMMVAFETRQQKLAMATWSFMKKHPKDLVRPVNWNSMAINEIESAMMYASSNNWAERMDFLFKFSRGPPLPRTQRNAL